MTNILVKVNLCFIILVLFHVRWGSGADKEEEQNANTVTIRYDRVTATRWNKEVDGIDNTEGMIETLTELVNSHCSEEFASCSLETHSEFSTSDVVVSSNSPSEFNGDVKMSFYVSIDGKDVDEDGDTMYVLPKATLSEICENGGQNLTDATNGGWTVDFVGDKRISPPIDRTVDSIMIPISILLLLFLVIITLILHFYHKKAEKKRLPTGDQGSVVLTQVKADNGGGQKSPAKVLSAVSPIHKHPTSVVSNKVTPNAQGQIAPYTIDDGYGKSEETDNSETPMVKDKSLQHQELETSATGGGQGEYNVDKDGAAKKKHKKKKKKKHKHKHKHRKHDQERSEDDDNDDANLVTPRFQSLPPLAEYRVRSEISQDVIYTV